MSDQRGLKPYDVEISLSARPDEVWAAVTRPPLLRQWFGWDYDGLDAEIRHIFVEQVQTLGPHQMGWADGSYLEITGDDARAHVRAARGDAAPADPQRYDAIEEAWRAFLVQLRFLIERRPQGRRRTLYLTGETTGHEALGLVDGPWERVGSRVAWTVDPAGALVVLAARAPLDAPEPARAEVTVSTYGVAKAAFGALREDWARRWTPIAATARITTAEDPAPNRA